MAASAITNFAGSRSRVLIASGNALFRKRVLGSLELEELQREEAVGGAQALAKLGEFPCESVLLDRHLPDLDAEEVASMIRERYPSVAVRMVDSRSESDGGRDVRVVADVLNEGTNKEAERRSEEFQTEEETALVEAEALPEMIGTSRAIQQVYQMARIVAPRDTTVVVTGETGTGKELVARGIHQLSRRSKQTFATVNCAAIPEALLESELFGYVRGAFTGAVQSRLGRIHVAHGGTLFLDEVGELPLSMQAKLLRFLQDGEVQRLGSSDVYRVDVRVICATNARLLEQVQAKRFRQDLYYRLAVFPIVLPPLRERPEDIKALAEHFLAGLAAEAGLSGKSLTSAGIALLEQRRWPGNVRELQHILERAFILAGNEKVLRPEHFQMCSESSELREI